MNNEEQHEREEGTYPMKKLTLYTAHGHEIQAYRADEVDARAAELAERSGLNIYNSLIKRIEKLEKECDAMLSGLQQTAEANHKRIDALTEASPGPKC